MIVRRGSRPKLNFGFRCAARNVCCENMFFGRATKVRCAGGRERGCDSTPEPHSPECMRSGRGAPHSSHATRSLVRLAAFRWQPRSPDHTEIGAVDCSSEQWSKQLVGWSLIRWSMVRTPVAAPIKGAPFAFCFLFFAE